MKLTEIATAILSMQSLLDKIVEKHEEIESAFVKETLMVCLDATDGFEQHYAQRIFKVEIYKRPGLFNRELVHFMHFDENSFPAIEAGLKALYGID